MGVPTYTNGTEPTFTRSVAHSSVTSQRPQAVDAANTVSYPSIARANAAVSIDKPNGDAGYSERFKDYTVLQQHVLFWDRDGDGQIFPYDTYIGFRELGFNILFSIFAMLIINVNFSYPTRLAYSYIPDVRFRLYVPSIHKAKHGSDSGVYDTEGRFLPQKFEDNFSKWDKRGDGTLTFWELFDLMKGNRCAADPYGVSARSGLGLLLWELTSVTVGCCFL